MTTNVNYNGWTNYATWRISLEVFDGYDFEDYSPEEITKDFCQDWAEELIFQNSNDDLLASYAHAFLNDVNWYEIAESIRETLEEINEYKNK